MQLYNYCRAEEKVQIAVVGFRSTVNFGQLDGSMVVIKDLALHFAWKGEI